MNTFHEAIESGRALVFGHRGASGYAPMNTIPAFKLAAEQKAVGIELDVRLTSDHKLVVIHDPTVDHTTNGSGEVQSLSLKQVQELDAGGWHSEKFRGVQIPTLDEVFEAVGQKLLINVEIKAETMDEQDIELAVSEAIKQHDLEARVLISSFNPIVLRRCERLMPNVLRGFLHDEETPWFYWHLLSGFGVKYEAVNPSYTMVDTEYMIRAKSLKQVVNTWTVNDPSVVIAMRDLGVAGIITNLPDMALRALTN